MVALKQTAINKQAFIFSKNITCMSIISPQHTCLVVLLERPGSGCFKGTFTYCVVSKDIHRESDVVFEASANVGYPKAWHTQTVEMISETLLIHSLSH